MNVCSLTRLIPPLRCWRVARRRAATVALLVDGDHVAPAAFGPLLRALAARSLNATDRRFYTVPHKAEKWEKELRAHGFRAVLVPRRAGGRKDPADLALALDAAELALRGAAVSGIAVASDDTDFALLLGRVRGWGLRAYVAMLVHEGLHPVHRRTWEDAGAEVVPYSLDRRRRRECLIFDAVASEMREEMMPEGLEPAVLSDEEHADVLLKMKRSGYLPEHAQRIAMDAVVTMLSVNRLSPMALKPVWLMEQHLFAHLVEFDGEALQRNPGDLVVIDRIKKGEDNDTLSRSRAGGPVVLRVGPELVHRVLLSLRFLQDSSMQDHCSNISDALSAFCTVNGGALAKGHGAFLEGMSDDARLATLHDVFTAPGRPQKWRVMLSDRDLRRRLRLQDDTPRPDVLTALRSFLTRRGVLDAADLSYCCAVVRASQHINRNNPENRSGPAAS